MINMKLLKSFPGVMKYIVRNIFFQWLSMIGAVVCTLAICQASEEIIGQADGEIISHASGKLLTGGLAWIPAVFAGILILFCGLRYWSMQQASKASLESSLYVKREMRTRLYAKMAQIGPAGLSGWSSAELTQLAGEGVEQLETYFAQYIPQFFFALLAPLTLFAVVCFIDWKAALVLLLCVPLIPVSIIMVQKFAKKLLNKYWGQYTQLGDSFLENLQGLTTLKIYQADQRKHEEMNEESEQFRKITMRVLIMQLNSISVMDLVAYGGSAAGILIGLSSFMNGRVTVFGMMAIVLLSAEFFLPMRLLGSYFHISMNGSAAADKMFAVLEAEVPEKTAAADPNLLKDIQAKDMSFAYSPQKQALKNVSFHIQGNGLYGIVGKSGSGKSTLSSVLTGRLPKIQGQMLYAGASVTDLPVTGLLENVTLLSHDSLLFEGTVEDNLRIAKEDASQQELWDVLKKAGIDEFLKEENGLQTPVLEGGSNFSGGQKQRIAFARALLKNSPVLVLDEATSNIDAESENHIMKQVHEFAKDHMVLCISHRLANVKQAETIFVLKEGVLEEKGNHEQLLKTQKEYASLWKQQALLESYSKGGE